MEFMIALVVALVSTVVPVQVAGVNKVREVFHSTPLALAIIFLIGSVGLGLFSMTGLLGRPSLSGGAGAPFWAWGAGLLLAGLMLTQAAAQSRVGAGAMLAATVVGQLIAGLLVDQFGAFGVDKVPINLWRVLGTVLLVGGGMLLQIK